jgi:hypothetical protein
MGLQLCPVIGHTKILSGTRLNHTTTTSTHFGIFTIGAVACAILLPDYLNYSASSTTPLWQLLYTPRYVDMIR